MDCLSPNDPSLPAIYILLKPNIMSRRPSSRIVLVYIMFFSAFKITALNKWSLLSSRIVAEQIGACVLLSNFDDAFRINVNGHT